jgi:hypothetical protein
MEHLPRVQKPYRPLKARYLGGEYLEDHFSDFGDFLQRNNLDVETIRDGTFGSHSREDVAQLLQSWFYFGMLQEMLQIPVKHSDFVGSRNDKGEAYITTEKLRGYLARWKDQIEVEKREPAVLEARNDRFIHCSLVTFKAWKELGTDFTSILGPDIALSIHLLATCLEHAANSVASIDADDLPWRATRNPIVTERLLKMGWCPTIVDQTEFSDKVALPYFLSLLGLPKDQKHLLEVGAPGCKVGDEGCKTKHVNNNTFRPKHTDESYDEGHCEFLGADGEEVRKVVEKGGIPIVHLNTDGEKPRIEVTALKGYMQYTAFSHV